MAALLPHLVSPATAPNCPSRSTSLSMSLRQKSCRAAGNKTPDCLPQSLSDELQGLPYTSAEWSKVIADVKREYLNRRYRPCVTRCSEILDDLKDSRVVEPAYLVYIHFYAASSQEMLARVLQQPSPSRTALLHQARDHYQHASTLINAADSVVGPALLRRPSGTTTTLNLPSLHSADSSVSSQASTTWTASHGDASPASSISSIQDAPLRPKRKKRVTFSDVPIELLERPDSPTLGLGTFLGRSLSPDPLDSHPVAVPAPLRPSGAIPRSCLAPRSTPAEHSPDSEFDPFRHARSVHRYSALLTSLQRQVVRHLTFIEAELRQADVPDDSPPPPSPSPVPVVAVHPVAPSADRAPELQARIERLRAKGWERKRFDVRRYEALRENAIADIVD
ncbi:hypothetical protein FZEAL_6194 [Fusarium zealandicum]|uniref:Uncharacterized protein n=1 Tax=Fusarium zealandicum TaxID=1053134 RepID=A0A8H4UJ04_9HYPO|nr:hypothetical protein FZEAL_6194 [Fusarium zealandicum]